MDYYSILVAVLTLNFIPKKGGSWWAIHLSVMSGVGGSKRLVMTTKPD